MRTCFQFISLKVGVSNSTILLYIEYIKVDFHLSDWQWEGGNEKIKYLIFNRETVCAKIAQQC